MLCDVILSYVMLCYFMLRYDMICYDAVVALETRISAQEDVRREAADAWEGHLREMQDNAGASRGEAQRAGHKYTRGAIGDEIFASGRTRKASKSPGSQSDAQRDARATDALELDLESASDFCLNFVFRFIRFGCLRRALKSCEIIHL